MRLSSITRAGVPASLCFAIPLVIFIAVTAEAGDRISRHQVIYEEAGAYCAWPTVVRAANGNIVVLFCRSEEHLGPDGEILACRSTDNGNSWFAPSVVMETPLDDRECGVTKLADGRLLGHFWSTFHSTASYNALAPGSYEKETLEGWKSHVAQPEYVQAKEMQGGWCALSTNAGLTWSKRERGPDAVHGGMQIRNGPLLCASYRHFRDSIGVFRSVDLAASWKLIAAIRSPTPDSLGFGEPHLLQLPSGRVIMMIRATAKPYNDQDRRNFLWETYSDNGGVTWTKPYATPLWGFPPHLLLLSDGRVLCTYGYRRPPFGERACISKDGMRWDAKNEIILRDDAPNSDLGYPASVELEPGKVLTVYYQPNVPPGTTQRMSPPDPQRRKPAIMGTVWKVD